jgi:hypothetical protein
LPSTHSAFSLASRFAATAALHGSLAERLGAPPPALELVEPVENRATRTLRQRRASKQSPRRETRGLDVPGSRVSGCDLGLHFPDATQASALELGEGPPCALDVASLRSHDRGGFALAVVRRLAGEQALPIRDPREGEGAKALGLDRARDSRGARAIAGPGLRDRGLDQHLCP